MKFSKNNIFTLAATAFVMMATNMALARVNCSDWQLNTSAALGRNVDGMNLFPNRVSPPQIRFVTTNDVYFACNKLPAASISVALNDREFGYVSDTISECLANIYDNTDQVRKLKEMHTIVESKMRWISGKRVVVAPLICTYSKVEVRANSCTFEFDSCK
jgi:hypothetical protein